jgi:hypothetical protein
MNFSKLIIFSFFIFLSNCYTSYALKPEVLTQINKKGEAYLLISLKSINDINYLSQIVSIDKIKKDSVIINVNLEEYEKFLLLNIPHQLILPEYPEEIYTETLKATSDIPNNYPNHIEYIQHMNQFASQFSSICHLVEFGRSVKNKPLLALCINTTPEQLYKKPAVKLSATIHGDEATGYVLLLKLIDTLLNGYQKNPVFTDLLDNSIIWINPILNPDGLFYYSDSSISGAVRRNANGIDLNRNFPDPAAGTNPDGKTHQPETKAVMNFYQQHPIHLSANLHDGIEVVNYPWDTWQKRHPDDNWFIYISRTYAEIVQNLSPSGYFDDLNNGITNGYDWYRITGGRQDYVTYFTQGREVTIEISQNKIPAHTQLGFLWQYHFPAFINFLQQAQYGIAGFIRDSITLLPIKASLFISNYDADESNIYSNDSGYYHRFLYTGNYVFNVSASGYYPKTSQAQAYNNSLTTQNIFLNPILEGQKNISFSYDNKEKSIYIQTEYFESEQITIQLYNLSGKQLIKKLFTITQSNQVFSIDANNLKQSIYVIAVFTKEKNYKEKVFVY